VKVDVVRIVGGAASFIKCVHPAYETGRDQLRQAHDAIAELIAADEEYDEAKAEFAKYEHDDDDDDLYLSALRRLQWATDRRATALLACKGQDHER